MWDELTRGSVGAVVLVDLRRIDQCFPAVDYFEDRRLPFVVAVNGFPGTDGYGADGGARRARADPDTPIVRMDARGGESCLGALIALVEHALERTAVAH